MGKEILETKPQQKTVLTVPLDGLFWECNWRGSYPQNVNQPLGFCCSTSGSCLITLVQKGRIKSCTSTLQQGIFSASEFFILQCQNVLLEFFSFFFYCFGLVWFFGGGLAFCWFLASPSQKLRGRESNHMELE